MKLLDYKYVDYWLDIASEDLGTFTDVEVVRGQFKQFVDVGIMEYFELPDRQGVIAYCETPDMLGKNSLSEMFMYVKKEHRSMANFKALVEHMEEVAKSRGLSKVSIASNIKYKDDLVIKALLRMGYVIDSVRKDL